MRVVAVSDIHGDFEPIYKILDQESPALLLCAGDWGKEDEVSFQKFDKIVSVTPTYTVFGTTII